MNHPIQPLYTDDHGVLRFKANAIVRYLLDFGGIDMNKLAVLPFSDEDRIQFAQLIGYSLGGFGDLSYVNSDAYGMARLMATTGQTEEQARITYLEGEMRELRTALREPMARLFDIASEDLGRD